MHSWRSIALLTQVMKRALMALDRAADAGHEHEHELMALDRTALRPRRPRSPVTKRCPARWQLLGRRNEPCSSSESFRSDSDHPRIGLAWRGRSALVVAVQRGAADHPLTSPVCVFASGARRRSGHRSARCGRRSDQPRMRLCLAMPSAVVSPLRTVGRRSDQPVRVFA